MIIEFTKRVDGSAVLKCVRPDGSSTWQRQEGNHATFFPLHDLTHYAVETELGYRRGFYGLIAEGWEIADTTGKGSRGALPNEALEVEYVVSALAAERAGDGAAGAEEFNDLAAAFAQSRGMPLPTKLTEDELARIRARFERLATKWTALPPGETMELLFG